MARQDSPAIEISRAASSHTPFLVVRIIFPSSSPSITSVEGITNLPGTEIQGVLQNVSSLSQQVWPEEGRATIGSLSFTVLDNASPTTLTDELRDQLANSNSGIRNREVRVYMGFSSDFNAFQKVATSFVDDVSYADGVYTVQCKDRSAALRNEVFEPRTARLAAPLTADDTTIACDRELGAAGWQLIATPVSFTDGPSGNYIWLHVKKTGEIIRASGITSNSFTGCARGRFNTSPQAVEYDQDRPAEIEEMIYLEGPAVWVARAVMTGEGILPPHWHLGIDGSVLTAAWDTIGEDLIDPNDLSVGFPVRFTYLQSTDGKKFIEKEIFRLVGVYAPTTVDGQIGLRRVSRVIDSGYMKRITDDHIIRSGPLQHDQRAVRNNFVIEWNYDGNDLTRRLVSLDAESVNRHGKSKELALAFRGLHTATHTATLILNRISTLRDRYAEPPLRLSIRLPWQFNDLQIGDTVRLESVHLEDYADSVVTMARNFEVQRVTVNWLTGEVDLELFASTRSIESATTNPDGGEALSAAWYVSQGTNINTLPGYVGGDPATLTGYNFVGSASDVNAAAAIFYHAGDLVIDGGFINDNVQIRVRGFLTIDGTLSGRERGLAGVAENQTQGATSDGWAEPGLEGYLGPTKGGSGCWYFQSSGDFDYTTNIAGGFQPGKNQVAPFLNLEVNDAGTLVTKFPKDLRGSSGGTGGQAINANQSVTTPGSGGLLWGEAGDGGDSGAGLAIVCRGLGFALGGTIDLSGGDGTTGQGSYPTYGSRDYLNTRLERIFDFFLYAGSGAGGMPGALHVLLDGDLQPYPDINSVTFVAEQGAAPPAPDNAPEAVEIRDIGAAFLAYPIQLWDVAAGSVGESQVPKGHLTGLNIDVQQVRRNIWRSAHRVQYVPAAESNVLDVVPAPQNLTATGGVGKIDLAWTWPGDDIRFIEVFESIIDDRTSAEEVAEVAGTTFSAPVPGGGTRWYWIRARDLEGRLSAWYPTAAIGGIQGIASDANLSFNILGSQSFTWSGAPPDWVPVGLTNTVTATVLQGGTPLASEVVAAVLDANTGKISWSVTGAHPQIDTSSFPAQGTPSPSVTLTFTHTVSGISDQVTLQAIESGVGAPGPPGLPGSRTIGIRLDTETFNGAEGSSGGQMYVHGYDPATALPADVDAEITWKGNPLTVVKGVVYTSIDNRLGGWIVLDGSYSAPFTVTAGAVSMVAARKIRENGITKWQYDDDAGGWVDFTPTNNMFALGTYETIVVDNIYTAQVFMFGLDMANISVQNPEQVQPGDVTDGALGVNLSEFAADKRPIVIWSGGALPPLPDTDYPTGTVLWWSVEPWKIYRVVAGAWAPNLDGNDLLAGSVTAGSLEAVMILGSLIRTFSAAGNRVELESGASSVFPFWIGSGTKGTVTGTPGVGAKVYYDQVADEFVVTGRLVSSTIESTFAAQDDNFAFSVDTAAGEKALLGHFFSGPAGVPQFITDTETLQFSWFVFGHPSVAGSTWDYRRLSFPEQMIRVFYAIAGETAVADTVTYEYKYRYDGGAWTSFSPTLQTQSSLVAGQNWRVSYSGWLNPKPTGWSTSVEVGAFASRQFSTGTVKVLMNSAAHAYVQNVGNFNNIGLSTEIS